MAKGSVPEPYAIINPNKVALNGSDPILTNDSSTYRGASVAVVGSIISMINPNIPTCRPMNLKRENAYAADAPRVTENTLVPRATRRLLLSNLRKVMHVAGLFGSLHNISKGSNKTRLNAAREAPGGIKVNVRGLSIFRGSSASEKIHKIGKSTPTATRIKKAWVPIWFQISFDFLLIVCLRSSRKAVLK